MILETQNGYILHTENTTYAFRVLETGQLEHVYYGKRIDVAPTADGLASLCAVRAFAPGNAVSYDQDHLSTALEDVPMEVSSYGKGDIRDPFVVIKHADGSITSDFKFQSAKVGTGGPCLSTLPSSYGENAENLTVSLKDSYYNIELQITYTVYEKCNVITRCSKVINHSRDDIKVSRLMSTQIDFSDAGYKFVNFGGAWVREMNRTDTLVVSGKHVNSSFAGVSSNRANPFVMVEKPETTEDFGPCYGFNLVYSGNHYEALEVSAYGKTRFVSGINPEFFEVTVEGGKMFESPEAVMTFSANGECGMSQNMHRFVRNHIVRGEWKKKPRPVLLNSWEANYFNINERSLVRLARAAKLAGIELFVMDDGWFGERNNDTSSLGDWYYNEKKLPHGISGLAEKIKAQGLDFGIWVEPEMVNADSNLFREHPDWALGIPNKPHSEGRNQRILDLTRKDVQDYIIEAMSNIFGGADISYVKWDMNRIFSDVYSSALPADRQSEVFHLYYIGFYRIMDELTKKFPHILFEGCASGGNRFDLGMLCYFPQIWASDNTDALCRVKMMTNYSYGYPMSTVTAHVSSCPNHQTLRTTPMDTRFNVAAFGVLGYECNLNDMGLPAIMEIKKQVKLYKQYRELFQFGDFYRGRNDNLHEWTVVSKDKKTAVLMLMQELAQPNTMSGPVYPKGLSEDTMYNFTGNGPKVNIKVFGDLINAISPIHIKSNGMLVNIASRLYKMPGDEENCKAYGNALMYGGMHIKPAFAGTGFSNEVRMFSDFASRMYFITAENLAEKITDKINAKRGK